MVCYNPLIGFKKEGIVTRNGKLRLNILGSLADYQHLEGKSGYEICPCGYCIGCRLEKSRQWAIRCFHEAQMSSSAYFITFTFADPFLPKDLSVSVEFHQKFMKRLRKEFGNNIRFMMCGEYGERFGRPHYHYCLFNIDLSDKVYAFSRNGFKYYMSARLAKVWHYGNHYFSDVTFESAAYVARYVTKKQYGESSLIHYNGRHPEFALMSRKPGLGAAWLEKYGTNVYDNDRVVIRNRPMKPPKYYDRIFGDKYPEWFEYVKANRIKAALARAKDSTFQRLFVRELVKRAAITRLVRPLESEL